MARINSRNPQHALSVAGEYSLDARACGICGFLRNNLAVTSHTTGEGPLEAHGQVGRLIVETGVPDPFMEEQRDMEIKGNFDRRFSGVFTEGLAEADDAGAVTSWFSPPVRRSALLGFFVVVLLAALGVAAKSVSAAPLFGPKTDFSTGPARAYSVTTDDFNRDGKPDLAVGSGSSKASVLLGDGTGGFGAKTDFSTAFPNSVTTDDFNGDGKPDLAVAGGPEVSVLLGDGTGSFGPRTDFRIGALASSVTTDDFNDDGKPDLAVADLGQDYPLPGVWVLLGDGTGGLGTKTYFATGGTPYSVTTDDFNRDGKPDLAAANQKGTVSVLLGDGTIFDYWWTDFTTGKYSASVTTDDFNSDGKPDLAVANFGPNMVSVLLGDGAGSFAPKTDFATGGNPASVTTDDFNDDGKPDLAVANRYSDTVSVLLGDGSGGFGAKTDFATGETPVEVTTADFNRDGKPDLAVANQNSRTVSVLLGTGQGAKPGIKRPGKTPVRVRGNRVIKVAKVKCREGTCQIKKVQVRFNIANRVFNGVGRFQKKIGEGRFAIVKTTMKKRLCRKLKRGRVSGTVTAVVTANSSNGSRNRQAIRTGLKR